MAVKKSTTVSAEPLLSDADEIAWRVRAGLDFTEAAKVVARIRAEEGTAPAEEAAE